MFVQPTARILWPAVDEMDHHKLITMNLPWHRPFFWDFDWKKICFLGLSENRLSQKLIIQYIQCHSWRFCLPKLTEMNRHTIFRHTRTGESMRTPIVDDDNPSSGSIISYNNQWTDGVLVTAHSSWYGWRAGSILSTLDECDPLITGYKSCVYIYKIYIYVHIHIVEYNDGIYIHYITSHYITSHHITL